MPLPLGGRVDGFQSVPASKESEARLLLLIDAFTQANLSLQGRVKLAELDFLLRYPQFYRRALRLRGRKIKEEGDVSENNIPAQVHGVPIKGSVVAVSSSDMALIGRVRHSHFGEATIFPQRALCALSVALEASSFRIR